MAGSVAVHPGSFSLVDPIPPLHAVRTVLPGERFVNAVREFTTGNIDDVLSSPSVRRLLRLIEVNDGCDLGRLLSDSVHGSLDLDLLSVVFAALAGLGEVERLSTWIRHDDSRVEDLAAEYLVRCGKVQGRAVSHIEWRLTPPCPSPAVILTARCLERPSNVVIHNLIDWSQSDDLEVAAAAIRGFAAVPATRVLRKMLVALKKSAARHPALRTAVVRTVSEMVANDLLQQHPLALKFIGLDAAEISQQAA